MKKITLFIVGCILFSVMIFAGNAYYVLTQSDSEKLNVVNQKLTQIFSKKDEAFKAKVISTLQTKRETIKSERNKAYIDYILQAQIPQTQTGTIVPPTNTEVVNPETLPQTQSWETLPVVPDETQGTGAVDETQTGVIMYKSLSDFPNIRAKFDEWKFEVYEGDEFSIKLFLSSEAPDNISIPYVLKGNITENEFYNYSGEVSFLKWEKEAVVSFLPYVDCDLDTNSIYIELVGLNINSTKITIKDTDEKNTDIIVSPSPYNTGNLLITGPDMKHLFFHTWSWGKYTIYYDKQECSEVNTVWGFSTPTSNEIECTPTSKVPYDGTRSVSIRYETGLDGICFWKK